MNIRISEWLLGLTFLGACVCAYATIAQRRLIGNWSVCAVFLLSATVELLNGMQHWIVFMLYGVAAVQAGVAISMQIRREGS